MCWNARVSINTFIITLFSIGLALMNKTEQSKILIFIFAFSLIQLIEYFLWNNLSNQPVNILLSNILILILIFQCFASINLIDDETIRKNMMIIFVSILLICLLFHNYSSMNTTVRQNGHLHWNWNESKVIYGIIYLIFFIGPAIFWKNEKIIQTLLFASITASLIFSYLAGGGFGTFWCWIANFTSLYLMFKVISSCMP